MEYGSKRLKLKKMFEEWFYYGGLPELQRFDDKRQWLNSLYQKIFFGDLIARYNIRNQFAHKLIVKKMAESVMRPLSFSLLTNIAEYRHCEARINLVILEKVFFIIVLLYSVC